MPREQLAKYPHNKYKNDFRKVREDRIKCCSGIVSIPRYWTPIGSRSEEDIMREACDRMGQMIAEKLFEFQKFRKETTKDYVHYHYWIEVIVPEGEPK